MPSTLDSVSPRLRSAFDRFCQFLDRSPEKQVQWEDEQAALNYHPESLADVRSDEMVTKISALGGQTGHGHEMMASKAYENERERRERFGIKKQGSEQGELGEGNERGQEE